MKMAAGTRHINRRDFFKAAGGALAIPTLGIGCGTVREGPGNSGRPNILFLMADQHRGDCLGCDGNSVIRTPHLDRLAGEGAHFSSGYSATPTCTPARSALLTGLSPWHHGMLGYGRVSNRYTIKLPRAMRNAGYHTFGIGKMHWFPQRTLNGFHGVLLDESGRRQSPGFISDYHQWFEKNAPGQDPNATGIGWNDHRSRAYTLPEELHPTFWTGQMAVDFINRYEGREPFLLKVSFTRPHSPYDPPARFMEMYREEDMPTPHLGAWAGRYRNVDSPFRNDLWHGDLGLDQVRHSRRGYYGSVSFIDEQIGHILEALETRELLKNTFIIYVADHGDMTGDHYLWRKSYAYEASARIPFLARWPESMGMDERRGETICEPVELRDVLPTFLDIAGEPAPGSLDGKSLLQLIRGNTPGWREYIDLEHNICYNKKNHWNALTDGKTKYIFHAFDGEEQLFDLKNDPGELTDLAEETAHGETLKMWRSRMVEHFQERGDAFVKSGKLMKRPKGLLYSPNYPGTDKS